MESYSRILGKGFILTLTIDPMIAASDNATADLRATA